MSQVIDRAKAGGVALDEDQLQPLAEDGFHGALVARVGAEHVGQQAVHAVAAALLLVAQEDRFDAPAVSLEVLLQLEQRGQAAAAIGQLFADPDEQRLGVAPLGLRLLQLVLVRRAALVQRAPVAVRLLQLPRHLVALPRDLDGARRQLLALAFALLQPAGQFLPAPLQVHEVRPVVGQPGQHRHRLVPFGLDRVLGGVDALGRLVQRRFGLRAPRLVFGVRVGELPPLGVEALLLAGEQLEPLAEQTDLVLVLDLPRGDRFALALRELHLLLGEAQLLVDAVRSIGELLHRAGTLDDERLDAPITLSVEGVDDEPTIRSLLSRLVGQIDMWNNAIASHPYDWAVEQHELLGSIRSRLDAAGPTFLAEVRQVVDEGRLEETFVDALCEPPEVFTYGGLIAHVLTFAAHRRLLVLGALAPAGITDLGSGDPRNWVAEAA